MAYEPRAASSNPATEVSDSEYSHVDYALSTLGMRGAPYAVVARAAYTSHRYVFLDLRSAL